MSALPDCSVRPAQLGDEEVIARLQVRAWRALMGDAALASQGITEEMVAHQWEVALGSPRPEGTVLLVALHAHTTVGFAFAGPDEAGAYAGAPTCDERESVRATQVYELVVDPSFRRTGHASRLLAVVADLTSGQLRVWVGADDEERQRFYSSAGFAPSGAVRTLSDQTQHMWWAQRD